MLRDTQAARFKETLQSVPQDTINQVFDRLAVGVFPGARGVVGSVEPGEDEIEVRLDLDIADACTPALDSLTCRALVTNQPLAPALASLPSRRFPLVLQLPIIRHHETMVHPPPGWTIDRQQRKLESRWGRVTEALERQADTVRSELTLEVYATTVAPGDYAEFARFCRAVDELLGRPPVLVPRR
jgi:hypothetical protein